MSNDFDKIMKMTLGIYLPPFVFLQFDHERQTEEE